MLASVCPKLPMIDAATTRAFYQNLLGFEVIGDYGDYILMAREGVELHFFAYPTLDPAKSDFMAYIRVDNNIATLHADLTAKGATPAQLRPLQTHPWGMREFSLVDPNGTCLTFGEGV